MTQTRVRIDGGANMMRPQAANDIVCSQFRRSPITTAGAGTLTAVAVTSGILERTGPVAAYIDTFPTAEQILLVNPSLNQGDSFSLIFRNTVAFAMTAAAGVGIVLGTNVDIIASATREYVLTVLAAGSTTIVQSNTTNASAVVTGLTPTQAALITPGMGVTGSGVPALTTVIGVNSTTGVITLSANATATATAGLTFFPRIQVEGVYSASL